MHKPHFRDVTSYQHVAIAQRKLKRRQAQLSAVSDTVRTQRRYTRAPGPDRKAVRQVAKTTMAWCSAGRAFEIPMLDARCRAEVHADARGIRLETREKCKRVNRLVMDRLEQCT